MSPGAFGVLPSTPRMPDPDISRFLPRCGRRPQATQYFFSTYENAILQYFASWSGGPNISAANPPNPDTSWMTVLAALAHETGHIRWAELNVTSPGGSYDFSKLHACNVNGVVKDFFANWNYTENTDDTRLESPNRWRGFGSRANAAGVIMDHSANPTLLQLGNPTNPASGNALVFALYQANQPWPSIFGAQSPEEDFVETHVFRVLMARGLDGTGTAYLQSLPLTIPGYTGPNISNQWADVPRDFLAGNKRELARRAACIHGYAPP